MSNLVLHLKGEYFDQIKAGTKTQEFRLKTEYWRKRLENRTYTGIVIFRGYPKRGDTLNVIECNYRGYGEQTITHKHFGEQPVDVYAIDVSEII